MYQLTRFGIKNFRVFKEYQEFEFKPLTILTGPNNSGKSSLIKFLLLLKENRSYLRSIFKNGNEYGGQISFKAEVHKLNNFDSIINTKKEPLIFKIHIYDGIYYRFVLNNSGKIEHTINLCDKDDNEILSLGNSKLRIDLELFIKYFASNIVVSGVDSDQEANELAEYIAGNYITLENHLKESKNKIVEFDISKIPDSDTAFAKSRRKSKLKGSDILKSAFNYFLNFDIETIPLRFDYAIIPRNDDYYLRYLDHIYYLPSIKGLQKRAYNYSDEDTLNQIIRRIEEKGPFNNRILEFKAKWIKEFELGDNITFGYNHQLGVNYIFINNRSLIDSGYGYTQIISIIFQVCEILQGPNRKISLLILEEPESNLHPSFQSKIAELAVDIYKKFRINVLIETHSEYLIRKLQYLTAKKEISTEDSVIYYFHHPDRVPDGEEQVKKIDINEDGSLTGDFGPGFFDEATNLKFELLKLKNPQKN